MRAGLRGGRDGLEAPGSASASAARSQRESESQGWKVGTEGSPGQLSLHTSGFSTEVSGNPSLFGSPCSLTTGLSLGDQNDTYFFEDPCHSYTKGPSFPPAKPVLSIPPTSSTLGLSLLSPKSRGPKQRVTLHGRCRT